MDSPFFTFALWINLFLHEMHGKFQKLLFPFWISIYTALHNTRIWGMKYGVICILVIGMILFSFFKLEISTKTHFICERFALLFMPDGIQSELIICYTIYTNAVRSIRQNLHFSIYISFRQNYEFCNIFFCFSWTSTFNSFVDAEV